MGISLTSCPHGVILPANTSSVLPEYQKNEGETVAVLKLKDVLHPFRTARSTLGSQRLLF